MSGSRGPLSHPNARRRNLPSGTKIQLPMEGWRGPIPDWPLVECTSIELERWERMWRTPMAAQWVRMHIDTVVARYVRVALLAESAPGAWVAAARGALAARLGRDVAVTVVSGRSGLVARTTSGKPGVRCWARCWAAGCPRVRACWRRNRTVPSTKGNR